MKKITFLWITMMLLSMGSYAQTTAVDFSLTDCGGSSRTLFPIIDSGNVVILVYEHQCGSCTQGSTNLKNAINTYFSAATNIRVMYLDNGGYPCYAIRTWITSNSLLSGPFFTYSNDFSSPYGSGMPVIVVTGTKSHKVYIIANNSGPSTNTSVTNLKNAIQSAITDISNGINSDPVSTTAFEIYPNPAVNDKVLIRLNNSGNKLFGYEISNTAGQIILTSRGLNTGDQQEEISLTDIENGVYFIYLDTDEGRIVRKLMISR